MNQSRLNSIARGVGSLVFLLALLVGPPALLWSSVGWPLPTSMPDVATMELAARSGISDDVIVNALAVLCWLAWMQIATAIIVEGVAGFARCSSPSLPALPGAQEGIARLVAAVTMMTASFSPAAALAAPPPPIPVVAAATPILAHQSLQLPALDAQRDVAGPISAKEQSIDRPTVTVERHDSYWAIAERTLGDGHRWREIRDLNVGRTMHDGHTIEVGSDEITTGWILELPADVDDSGSHKPAKHGHSHTAAMPPHETGDDDTANTTSSTRPASDAATAPATPDITVQPGDSFWIIAEQQLTTAMGRTPTDLEILPYWQSLIDANRDRLVQPGNPDLIYPGQELCVAPVGPIGHDVSTGSPHDLVVPASLHDPDVDDGEVDHQPDSPPPVAEADTSDGDPADVEDSSPVPLQVENPPQQMNFDATTSDLGAEPPIEPAQEIGATSAVVPLATGAAASVLLAAGATQAIRRRRRRAAHRSPNVGQAPTPQHAQSLHRDLLAAADEPAIAALQAHLDALADAQAERDGQARPRVAQQGPGYLDVLVDQPNEPPPDGWRADDDSTVWALDTIGAPTATVPRSCAMPLLVTLGEPDEGGQLYLDLEAEGMLALTGDDDIAECVARTLVAELALSPLTDAVQIIVVGDLISERATALEHVKLASEWADVSDDLAAAATQSHDALVANGWSNTFVARGHEPDHDALTPVVVIANEPPPDGLREHLLANRPAPVAVVAMGEVPGATEVVCTPRALAIPSLGLTCTPKALDLEALDTVLGLLDDSSGAEPAPSDDDSGEATGKEPDTVVPVDALHDVGDTANANDDAGRDPTIRVRVLGEISIEGAEDLTAKQTAVVTYIALHGAVTGDRLENAVWSVATNGSRRKRLSNTLSECRAAIGRRALPVADDGRYRAGAGLVTDLQQFELLVERASQQPAAEAVATLREALALLTGPIFTYRSADRAAFTWVDVENWVSRWEVEIAGAAQQCADLLIELERADEAVAVAQHAVQVIPTHSGLTETLMRAHATNGDRHALTRVFQEHVGALEGLDLDEPGDSVVDLFERLTGATSHR